MTKPNEIGGNRKERRAAKSSSKKASKKAMARFEAAKAAYLETKSALAKAKAAYVEAAEKAGVSTRGAPKIEVDVDAFSVGDDVRNGIRVGQIQSIDAANLTATFGYEGLEQTRTVLLRHLDPAGKGEWVYRGWGKRLQDAA